MNDSPAPQPGGTQGLRHADDAYELRARVAELEAALSREREVRLDAEDALERLQAQHDVLENFVFGLEREHERSSAKLLRTQEELEASYRRVQALKAAQDEIFAHVEHGLLLLDPDHRIQPQHSRAALELFGRGDLAGLRFEELFPETLAVEVAAFVELLFASYHGVDQMFERLSPLRDHADRWAEGAGRALSFSFVRVRDAAERRVARVLVVVTDRTREVSLRRELEDRMRRQSALVERAWQVLSAPPSLFAEFLAESRGALRALRGAMAEVIDAGQTQTPLRDLLREAHTLKGNARALELGPLADGAHALEEVIVRLRTAAGPEARRELGREGARLVESLSLEVEEGANLFARFEKIRKEMATTATDAAAELAALLARAAEREAARRGVAVRVELASKLPEELAESVVTVLRNPLLSLVRNAVAHAAEPPAERAAKGKPEVMVVTITAFEEGGGVVTVVRDDGRGIDVAKVRSAGAALEEEGPASAELLRLVSQPGLSTAKGVDELAGRGMGMDIVAVGITSLGGRLQLDTRLDAYTEFRIWLPRAALDARDAPARAGGM